MSRIRFSRAIPSYFVDFTESDPVLSGNTLVRSPLRLSRVSAFPKSGGFSTEGVSYIRDEWNHVVRDSPLFSGTYYVWMVDS
jgi:hypothetical protein